MDRPAGPDRSSFEVVYRCQLWMKLACGHPWANWLRLKPQPIYHGQAAMPHFFKADNQTLCLGAHPLLTKTAAYQPTSVGFGRLPPALAGGQRCPQTTPLPAGFSRASRCMALALVRCSRAKARARSPAKAGCGSIRHPAGGSPKASRSLCERRCQSGPHPPTSPAGKILSRKLAFRFRLR